MMTTGSRGRTHADGVQLWSGKKTRLYQRPRERSGLVVFVPATRMVNAVGKPIREKHEIYITPMGTTSYQTK